MTKPRTSRESETRNHEMLDIYDIDYANPLSIPPEARREGYDFHWTRASNGGDMDYRVQELLNNYWTPVPPERLGKANLDVFDTNPLSKKVQSYKDVILLERPSEYSKRQHKKLAEFNDNRIKSLRGVSNDMGAFTQTHHAINSF
jgi:hypothetical protein